MSMGVLEGFNRHGHRFNLGPPVTWDPAGVIHASFVLLYT